MSDVTREINLRKLRDNVGIMVQAVANYGNLLKFLKLYRAGDKNLKTWQNEKVIDSVIEEADAFFVLLQAKTEEDLLLFHDVLLEVESVLQVEGEEEK